MVHKISLPPTWETQTMLQAPGFLLTQSWLLLPFGDEPADRSLLPSLSLGLTLSLRFSQSVLCGSGIGSGRGRRKREEKEKKRKKERREGERKEKGREGERKEGTNRFPNLRSTLYIEWLRH